MYQARSYGFEAELTAAEGKGLSVRSGVFDDSSVDSVRLRNERSMDDAYQQLRGMALEIVQRSEVPNDVW